MMHFTLEDWRLFANDAITGKKREAMERHVLSCDSCMERYLSCFTEESANKAVKKLSPQFTGNVMKGIAAIDGNGGKNRHRYSTFPYYVAAACITMILMSVGVFEGLAYSIPQIAEERLNSEKAVEFRAENIIRYGWSDRLMDKTLTLVDSIKPKE